MRIKLFLAGTVKSRQEGIGGSSIYCNGSYFSMPPKLFATRNGLMTNHRLMLMIIADFFKINSKRKMQIDIYTTNENVIFEWNTEWKQDHHFAGSTADQDIWQEIIRYADFQQLDIAFCKADSALMGVSVIERKKLDRD